MIVAKNNITLADTASLSPKSNTGGVPSSGDFSAALNKVFSSHTQSSSNKSDVGSGTSSRHSHSQNQDTTSSNAAHSASTHQDAATPQQQPTVALSMLAMPNSIVFGSQQPAAAAAPPTSLSAVATDLTVPANLQQVSTSNSVQSSAAAGVTSQTIGTQTAGMTGKVMQSASVIAGGMQPANFVAGGMQPASLIPAATGTAIHAQGEVLPSQPAPGTVPSSSNTFAVTATPDSDAISTMHPVDSGSRVVSTIDPTAGYYNMLFSPREVDTDASGTETTTIPTMPVAPVPVNNAGLEALPVPQPPVTQIPVSQLPIAQTPVVQTPVVQASLAPSVASTSNTSDSTSEEALAAAAPTVVGAVPAKASETLATAAHSSQPTPTTGAPSVAAKPSTPAAGHNQIASAHQPAPVKEATSKTAANPVAPAAISAGHAGDDLGLRSGTVSNGSAQTSTAVATVAAQSDSPVSAPKADGNSTGTVTAATTASPVAANGAASLGNDGDSDNGSSSDSKDRSKDDAVTAVATTVQVPLSQTMQSIGQTVTAAAVPAQHAELAAPSTSHLPGSINAKSQNMETASITDTKSVINTSKLMQTVNQSEMRVGMHSAEFGDISIRAQATHDSILTQISVDHPELASSLATHIPDMQARLASHGNLEVQVNSTQSHSGLSSSSADSGGGFGGAGSQTGSQSGRQQDQSSSTNSYFSNSYGNIGYGNSALPAAAIANSLQNAGYDGRLDLQA